MVRTSLSVQDPARELLALVRETVAELRPATERPIALDDPLEQAGVDSLARAQLSARIEQRFGVALTDEQVLGARTPRDLLEAVLAASPARAGLERAVARPDDAGQVELPARATTLVEALEHHAARVPDRVHVVLHEERQTITYRQLLDGARQVAAGLQRAEVIADDAVAIMLPSGRDYFVAFFGVLLAGAVPVPIYPPAGLAGIEAHLRRQAKVLANARAVTLITWPGALRVAHLVQAGLPGLRRVTTVDELRDDEPASQARTARRRHDDVALLQYTSGSTGDPKGVVLTHANLLANVRAMGVAARVGPQDVIVSWLPLYHDMGLIGAWLGGLYHGCRVVILSPMAFVARPARWLEAITAHRGTISAAPNFAYGLCAAKLDAATVARLDLSSWRLAFNGSEPVSSRTIDRFVARFAPRGFDPGAMAPVYGLAECSVGLCFPPPGRGPRIDRVAREPLLREGVATPALAGGVEVVGCGRPLPDHEVRVGDDAGREAREREVGRVEFRGPSATRGYRDHEAATKALLRGDGWLDTGDCGYLADGELFLTGRQKDVVIRAGRNVFPYELEAAVSEVPGVRKGGVAVFATRGGDESTEQLVVAAETRLAEDDGAARAALRERVAALTMELLQVPADVVVLLPPRSVPKTANGKVRRGAARELFERGELGRPGAPVPLQVTRLFVASLGPRLRRAGRALERGLYGAWAWLLLVLLAPIAWTLAMTLPTVRARRVAVRALARLLFSLGLVRIVVTGRERLPRGPCVLVANHASYLDALLLVALLPPRFSFAAKRELADHALLAPALRRLGLLFVERHDPRGGVEDTSRLAQAVRAGESLVVFAEGTFDRAPGLLPFHMGGFVVAAGGDVPVVPVALRGTRALLRGDDRWPRRGDVEVTFGNPLHPPGPDWADALALRDAARAAIRAACGEPDREA